MNKLISFPLIILFGISISSCATTKIVTIEDRPDPTNGKSNVVVYATLALPHLGFMVDSVDKGVVAPGKPLYFQVEAGMHTRTPLLPVIDRKLTFTFSPNTTHYFRLEHKAGMWVGSNYIIPTDKIESYQGKY
jgi:hypothetical protein